MSGIRMEQGGQIPDGGAEVHTLEVDGDRAKVIGISRGADEYQPRPCHIDTFEGREKKFAAFFNLVPNEGAPAPNGDEVTYIKYFNGTMGNLADYELRDENGDKARVNLPEVLTARDEFAAVLIEEAKDFIDGYPVFDCLKTTARKRGRFRGEKSA